MLLAAVLYAVMAFVPSLTASTPLHLLVNTVCLVLFLTYVVRTDFPLSRLPWVGKYVRR